MTVVLVARNVAEMIESRPLPSTMVALEIPEREPDEPLGAESYGYAEGQSFIIEYRDSGGKASRRPITVFSIEAGASGVAVLKARCHLRKTTRGFRVDRIGCCIDFDGQVHDDVPQFLVENFGMHPGLAALTASREDGARWSAILGAVRDDAIILSAMAHSDGEYHAREIEAMTDHLARLAERDVMLSPAEIAALGRYVRKLRPDYDRIVAALSALGSRGASHCQRLLHACVGVMDADGMRRPEEYALLNELSRELLGAGVSA